MLYDPLRYGVLSSDDRYSVYYIIHRNYEFFYCLQKNRGLYLFRRTDLRQNFEKMPTDLFRVHFICFTDEPDGIRQQDAAFCFLRFIQTDVQTDIFLSQS